jgi:hypothetical protein
MRKPLEPKSLLAAQMMCTREGSIFTAPSGTRGSVSDRAETNFGLFRGVSLSAVRA